MLWNDTTLDKTSSSKQILSVSTLNRLTRDLLANTFSLLWIEGEISNFLHHRSGHMYFSLKDEQAQINCAYFRHRHARLEFTPADGMHVLVHAHVSLYEQYGKYQLIVEHLEEAGQGALRRAFDQLKQQLQHQGLFALEHKRALPVMPRGIGVITSTNGAAIQDILTVLARRFPALPVKVFPTNVQGAQAAPELLTALKQADQNTACDVLVLARGGGRLEDLWAFNDAKLARQIFHSRLPVVTGIGHEVDFTIADLVADERAPTPSAAAELVSPNQQQWLEALQALETRLQQSMQRHFNTAHQQLSACFQRLRHPRHRLQQQMQTVDALEQRLMHSMSNRLLHWRYQLHQVWLTLQPHHPRQVIKPYQQQQRYLGQRLDQAMQSLLAKHQQRWQTLSHTLHTVSPLATLERGYAIVRDHHHRIVRNAQTQKPHDTVTAIVAQGALQCQVTTVYAHQALDEDEGP